VMQIFLLTLSMGFSIYVFGTKECLKGPPTNAGCSFGDASQPGLKFGKITESHTFQLCDVCILFAANRTARPHVDYLCFDLGNMVQSPLEFWLLWWPRHLPPKTI
jgi:hypothetical protein